MKRTCRTVPDLRSVTHVGEEVPPWDLGLESDSVERLWRSFEALYRTGLYPAIQVSIRHRGQVALQRAIGHASGNSPGDPSDSPRIPATVDTPFLLYSASKAITAMVIHKLDEQHKLHLDDRVCEYIPEFAQQGKEWITIRHVLGHRAGIPNLPPGTMDLELLDRPDEIIRLLSHAPKVWRPGHRLAYHAVSGGFVLGEIVRRVTGQDIRHVLRKEVVDPLGFRWMNFGVADADVSKVARDAFTGLPVWPPFSWLFQRVLGTSFEGAVQLASDPRFLRGIVPAANIVSTADELSAFYQCLLNGGELDGVRIFDRRTVQHATSEQTFWELDLTLGIPLRYGLGFMLGGDPVGLFGWRTPRAFGHLGLTNILSWADPDRELSVAILTSGKPFLSLDVARLLQAVYQVGASFPIVAA